MSVYRLQPAGYEIERVHANTGTVTRRTAAGCEPRPMPGTDRSARLKEVNNNEIPR